MLQDVSKNAENVEWKVTNSKVKPMTKKICEIIENKWKFFGNI